MTSLQIIQSKIHTSGSLALQVNAWKLEHKKIVFTNGCFDIFHLGHLDYLSKASDLGDVLIIGINSDNSVATIKGQHRPIIDEKSRTTLIAALSFVSGVILFDEATPLNLISSILPDVLVKGSDYQQENIVGYDVVKQAGGLIQTIDLIPGYSTSLIEKKIIMMNHRD
jgi:rfaE bifunctional protein nucleotidyltransferase chain/domain